ncbi:MAG: translocation/assembly module TamB domain-containing protein [Haliscomenobacter sp.]|uniref:translocation/assembly module TamB domain-containing protein n=1 Tax=Haliscomenobacter sp. TaxID=2717303 RepID=UPI00299F9DED|nr:translocation/assembly module TamB domain-containing protein [Haliscomenobacter sp.]MDX2068256.1 translocation/assembly module TamB domain-containing protein [Haliscomenobacter sp.]
MLWQIYRRVAAILRVTLTVTAVSVTVLFLLFQIPIIQEWAIDETTKAISKTTHTRTEVGHFRLSFFNQVVLKDVYFEDDQGDTLLFCKSLNAQIKLSPITLIREGLVFDELSIREGRFNIQKAPASELNNLEILLQRLFPPQPEGPKKEKKPFGLAIKKLNLDKVVFLKNDLHRGQRMEINIYRGRIAIDKMNLPQKILKAKYIRLKGAKVFIDELNYGPGYEESLTEIEEQVPLDSSALDTSRWKVDVAEIDFSESVFKVHNYRKAPKIKVARDTIDFAHMEVQDIDIKIQDFKIHNDVFSGKLGNISLREKSGFELSRLAAKEAIVSSQEITLNGAALVTPHSNIGDTIQLKFDSFDDFGDFPNLVRMDNRFNGAQIAMRDIMAFASDLTTNPFFRKNKETTLSLDGRIYGLVNNLNGRNFRLLLPDGTFLQGKFDARNLAVKDNESIDLRMDQLSTSMRTLRDLLPNFSLPRNFDKLGKLEYRGEFIGFFNSFTTIGQLSTSIGSANLNVSLKNTESPERASYSGTVVLNNFDLGKWTDNKNFGKISLLAKVGEGDGYGLAGKNARAKLSADIKSFEFKGYKYTNAQMQGELKARKFDGNLVIADNNIDLNFTGKVDLSKDVPEYNFYSSINKLNLQKLNFSKEEIVLTGNVDVNFQAKNLVDLVGRAEFKDFDLNKGDQTYHFKMVDISSTLDSTGNRKLDIASDAMDAHLNGRFDIEKIPAAFQLFIYDNFPGFAQRFKMNKVDSLLRPQQFKYDIKIKNSGGLHELLNAQLGPLKNFTLSGEFDNLTAKLITKLDAPEFRFGSLAATDLGLRVDLNDGQGFITLNTASLSINDKQKLPNITLQTSVDRDTIDFGLTYADKSSRVLSKVNLDGRFFIRDSNTMLMRLSNSDLHLLNTNWSINPLNTIIFGKDYIDVQDFALQNGAKSIRLDRLGRKGIKLGMNNMDLGLLNGYLNFEPMEFGGRCNLEARVEDLLGLKNIGLSLISDTLFINKDDWGLMRLDVKMRDRQHPLEAYFSLTKDTAQLLMEGYYNLSTFGESTEQQARYFDANLNIHSYPLNIADYFVGDVFKNLYGYFDTDIHLNGDFSNPNIVGKMYLMKGGFTVDYLKTNYTFERGNVDVDNFLFDLSGMVLYDKRKNRARLDGGIRHDHLKRFGFNASLNTLEPFFALDTKKGDNEQFYGQAIGMGKINFSGSFQRPDISVIASVGEGSRLIIPVSNERKVGQLDFVRFVEKTPKAEKAKDERELTGVGINLDITVQRGAEMQIIFNEQSGDVIKGAGRGAVQISVPRGGDFKMFGEIVIDEGEYLFTLYNLFNKGFRVKEGGTLTWNGDPFGAIINLEAEYRDLSASVYSFIQEYLVAASDELKAAANTNTNIDLRMKLRGDLLKPTIDFDLAFPNLRGELQSFAESKIRILKQDQNELNKQVSGLILFGQFLPADFALGTQARAFALNSVSELVSNQVSLMVTELLKDLVGEGVLSDINFNVRQALTSSGNNEFQFSLKPYFLKDRLSVQVGGNIQNNVPGLEVNTFVGTDVVIEYAITPDRNLKLRIFQKLQPDVGGRRFQLGTGLSFRKEYDSFADFIRSFKRKVKGEK